MSTDRIWLVRSSNQILGPFNLQELEDQIRKQAIFIIDEVNTPCGRWRYVREEPKLAHLVRELREFESSRNEATVTSTIGTSTLDYVLDTDEASQVDISIEFQDLPNEPKSKPNNGTQSGFKTYGISNDENLGERIKRTSYWVWAGALVSALLIVGAFVLQRYQETAPPPGESFTDLLEQGVRAKNMGMKERALSLLERAAKYEPDNNTLKFHLAPLQAVLEGQTLSSRRVLSGIVDQLKDPNMTMEGYTAIGLTYLLEEDLSQARNYFEKALSIQRSYLPAILNLATVYVKEGKYEEALKLYHSASINGSRDPLVEIGPGIVRLEAKGQNSLEINGSSPDSESLSGLARNRFDAKQEALVLAAKLQLQSSDRQAALALVREAIDWDPDMTREHLHPLLINRQLISWEYLVRHCRGIHEELSEFPESHALMSYCLLRAGDDDGARQILSRASVRFPRSPYLGIVEAYLYRQLGREPEANLKTQEVLKIASFMRLPNLFKAQQCELDGDYQCAQKHWDQIQRQDSKSLEAHKGLAWMAYRQKKYQVARQHVQKGLELSENYLPLLELREVLSQ